MIRQDRIFPDLSCQTEARMNEILPIEIILNHLLDSDIAREEDLEESLDED